MRIADARSRCPEIVLVRGSFADYVERSRRVMEVFRSRRYGGLRVQGITHQELVERLRNRIEPLPGYVNYLHERYSL